MAYKPETNRLRCEECMTMTPHSRVVRMPNHVLHLLLTIVMFFVSMPMGFLLFGFSGALVGVLGSLFWIVIWICVSIYPDAEPWRCKVCGTPQPVRTLLAEVGFLFAVGIPLMLFLAWLVSQ